MIGICMSDAIQLTRPKRLAAFAAVRTLGVTTVRVEVPWVKITSEAAWRALVDPLFADLRLAGLDPLVVIAHPPTWATPAALGLFCRALLRRVPDIGAVEIYNEMNLQNFGPTNPKVYTPLLIAAHRAIKDVSPATTVVLGGLAACATPRFPWSLWTKNVNPDDYLRAVHKAGGVLSYDVVGYHPYSITDGFIPEAPSPRQKYIAMVDTIAGIAVRPVWCTEFGFSRKDWSAERQAAHLGTELDILTGRAAAERAYVYSLLDVSGERFGIMDDPMTPRPAASEIIKAVEMDQS